MAASAASDGQLYTADSLFREIREEVDPEQRYDPDGFSAALQSLGLTLDDVNPKSPSFELNPRVPQKNAAAIKKQRSEVWDGLRQQRLREVTRVLADLDADDRRRFNHIDSDGVRPVDWSRDVPPAGALKGMGDFEKVMEEKQRAQKREQQRKATKLATDFLMEKKRMDDADANLAALEARLKEYKKEQEANIKARRNELEKQAERRAAGAAKAREEQAEREDEMEAKMNEKLTNARARRTKYYSKENLQSKIEAANAKREFCFQQAVEQEERMLNDLEQKREALEDRLEARRQQMEEDRQQRRELSAKKSFDTQVRVQAHMEETAENKLKAHKAFMERFDSNRANNKEFLKTRSKSTGDITKKAIDKWRSRSNQLANERSQANEELMQHHEDARLRCEERAKMKLKCDNDVFSFREVKDGTYGELTRKRQREYQRSRDNTTQALVFRIAEQMSAAQAKARGKKELWDRRQDINRELLIQKTMAEEAFRKIQCEGDPKRITEVMTSLGFEMPKLPEEDGGEGEESKAF
eukprot:TRINITY_DN63491_c1_g1_i1.p1 TRINITY_DN63491_c1_g1~~TRINITY_DN63491_c1_g1_i1.p1  ORF type:complete len:558 (+),score=147.74 TRINITY_DN63491_c1_g1_i1:92-1675(+)